MQTVETHSELRIAQVAPLYESVPPQLYGGTERVVSHLTEALVRRGHDVTLFASGDSVTAATLKPFCARALRLDPTCRDPLAHHIRMLGHVYQHADEFDLIHCHTDYLSLPMARLSATPTLVTLHGRLDLAELAPLYAEYRDVALVSISDNQRVPLPHAGWIATVHHGIPSAPFSYNAQPDDYVLFLGRISPEKRPDLAIRVARRAGVPLRIAAKIDAADEAYFEAVVRPLLDGPGVEFLGEVGDVDKILLLRKARALLFPIDWPEPFGLVMIEALACGTPVVARPLGSVPEVLRHGVTAWLGESEDELVDGVGRIAELDRAECRAEYERRFTDAAMTERYLAVYAKLLTSFRSRLAKSAGAARGDTSGLAERSSDTAGASV